MKNPFEFEAATKLSAQDILAYYCEDYNYSRFVQSTRNVFLVGERGVGKTMALKYYSLPVEVIKKKALDFSVVCIYITCQTPLNYRSEDEILIGARSPLFSEHQLVIQILSSIVDEFSKVEDKLGDYDIPLLRKRIEYSLGVEIPDFGQGLWSDLKALFQNMSKEVERSINAIDDTGFVKDALSFGNGVVPFLETIKLIPILEEAHFSLMIDDAQMLREQQVLILNSWISYRDNTLFSFKVATTRVEQPTKRTLSGGGILEGHDYVKIDMERPHQNKNSNFGKLARDIIVKRLDEVNLEGVTPEEFFPVHKSVLEALEEAKKDLRIEYVKKHPEASPKSISDHVYKYARVSLFRNRGDTANLPLYSGFETLTHLSTGVIRYLLEPCHAMFDEAVSDSNGGGVPTKIKPSIQAKVIKELSDNRWRWLKDDLAQSIPCNIEDQIKIYNLFDQLALHFSERLKHHESEPRATMFLISARKNQDCTELDRILRLSQEAQILYTYHGPAKESKRKTTYYVPNRILWPTRGLDVYEQHAKASIQAKYLIDSMNEGKKIPLAKEVNFSEKDLFDE